MKFMKFNVLVLIASAVFLGSSPTAAEPEFAREESVRELIRITNADALGEQLLDQMFSQYKKIAPQIPGAFWDKLRSRIDMDEVVDITIPVYQKYLSEKDVQELIAFHNTPLGQKMLEVTPKIMSDSLVPAMDWGARIGKQVAIEFNAEMARLKAGARATQ